MPCKLDHLGRADRNLEGVRKCILHAVWQAQGQGCAPGAVGVCIGSDRAHGYELAKEQLFRTLDDVNPNPMLAKLEAEIMEEANRLGVGRDGIRRQGVADRLQDHGGEPAAGELLRVAWRTTAGRSGGWACGSTRRAARSRSGCIAIRRARWSGWRAAKASR